MHRSILEVRGGFSRLPGSQGTQSCRTGALGRLSATGSAQSIRLWFPCEASLPRLVQSRCLYATTFSPPVLSAMPLCVRGAVRLAIHSAQPKLTHGSLCAIEMHLVS